MKETEINIHVTLDENHIPEKISWNAPDGGVTNQETQALILSVWDQKAREALRIDLWGKEMAVQDMKIFLHQMLVSLAQTYQRATGEDDVAAWMGEMAEEFAVKSAIK